MGNWGYVFAVIGFFLIFPYIRMGIKRIILIVKLRKTCRKYKRRLFTVHPLWFFGGRGGKNCDFYVETAETIYSVKLFGIKRRMSILIFTENGGYIIRNFIAFISNIGASVRFPIDSKQRRLTSYNFHCRYRNEWYVKNPKQILLVNPVCHEIRRRDGSGKENVIGSGEVVNGMQLYSLSRLLTEIEISL